MSAMGASVSMLFEGVDFMVLLHDIVEELLILEKKKNEKDFKHPLFQIPNRDP